jgi:diguanylate cyclase (GGDEF)-like protein/PAS domain S-box-containing protein
MRINQLFKLKLWLSLTFLWCIVVLWCIAAWLIADNYYATRVQNIVADEMRITKVRADDLSDSIRRNLHFMKGIPNMVSHLVRVGKATKQFGTSNVPSPRPYEVRKANWAQNPVLNDLSQYLAVVQANLNVDIIFLLNAAGDCIAASNLESPSSSIGTNYAEREYFLTNISGQPGMQYAVGKTTHIPGMYFSGPILKDGHFMGAVVSKIDIPNLTHLIATQSNTFVTDQNGVIILAHEHALEMQALPGAAVFSLSNQNKMARYLRGDFPIFSVNFLADGQFPGLLQILQGNIPHLRVSRELPEFGLTAHVENDLQQLSSLAHEQIMFFLLLAFFGSTLILSVTGIFHYLNTVRKSKATLQESEEKLRGLFELSPLGLALTDMHGNYIEFNESFRKICGYSEQELKTLDYWTLTPKEYEPLEAVQLDAMRLTGHYGPYEKEYIHKDGTRIPILLNGMLVSGRENQHLIWSIVEDITEKKNRERLIWTQAYFDELTNLPNRRLLLDRLQQALVSNGRSGKEGALLFIDLDNFKTLNDTLGHDIGDLLLKQVAKRLTECVREGDTVARLGGDEFVVMLEGLSDIRLEAAEQTKVIGAKILDSLNNVYMLGPHEHHSTPSIGATLFIDPRQPIENLLKHADIAMYQAKKAGRNTLRFFDPQMQEAINTHANLESDLRRALTQNQFQLHYQVQVDSSLSAIGAEALIRWMHPERGVVSPAQFIPLAESSGLILPIGQWVLDTACAQIKSWQNDARTRNLVLAVNVSAKQFHQADFTSLVRATLIRHDINPRLLKLELTESMLLDDTEETITTMNTLKEIDIQFSLDDFGTGYSSLQYLKRLPLNQLKIDQSFVRDIDTDSNDKAIIRTVIAMAKSMSFDVIAEGVETEEQKLFLINEGCEHFQGYLFGKPVPIGQFNAQLK